MGSRYQKKIKRRKSHPQVRPSWRPTDDDGFRQRSPSGGPSGVPTTEITYTNNIVSFCTFVQCLFNHLLIHLADSLSSLYLSLLADCYKTMHPNKFRIMRANRKSLVFVSLYDDGDTTGSSRNHKECDTILGIGCVGMCVSQSEDPFICFGSKLTQRACARDLPRDQKRTREGRSQRSVIKAHKINNRHQQPPQYVINIIIKV